MSVRLNGKSNRKIELTELEVRVILHVLDIAAKEGVLPKDGPIALGTAIVGIRLLKFVEEGEPSEPKQ